MSHPATNLAVLLAIAKQMPCAGRIIAVFTPTTSPAELTSGPPELPWIQCGIGLNNIVDQTARLRMHRATERADHARSDARLKAERITNRDYELTYAQILRVGQAHMSELRRIDSNHSEIGVRIVARHLRRIFASIRQIYGDRIRRMNDVAISQNESVRRDDETRPIAAGLARSTLDVHALFDVDVHDGRERHARLH